MTTPERRAELMREEGIEQVLILPFTARDGEAYRRRSSCGQLLVERLGARAVLVGDNFRFGHRQAGNVGVLKELGRRLGFETEIVRRGLLPGPSGEQQRNPLADRGGKGEHGGAAAAAALWAGRGGGERARRGSKQTVPTLNLATAAELIPARGVYVTQTRDLDDGRAVEFHHEHRVPADFRRER